MKKSVAFVIGNGTSRKNIYLEYLKQYGVTYSCNALHRDFESDYLVAVDPRMVLEIDRFGYQHTHEVWTFSNKKYNKLKKFNFFEDNIDQCSGSMALWLASQHGYSTIYILGFDFDNQKGGPRYNNIYADTCLYGKSTDAVSPAVNIALQNQRVFETSQIIKDHPHINYQRVILSDTFCPLELNNYTNFKNILIKDFRKIFNFSHYPPKFKRNTDSIMK